MPDITMTITAKTHEELFSTIKGAAAMLADGVPAAEPTTELPAEPTNTPPSTEAAPEASAEPQTTVPDGDTAADTPPEVKTYTLERVRKTATEASRKHGTEKVKAVLKEFNATGVGALDSAVYTDFVARLEAI